MNSPKRYFEIPGKPMAKQRPKFSRQGAFVRTYTPQQTVNYENFVRDRYLSVYSGHELMRGNIAAYIEADFPIPKSTSKKRTGLMLHKFIRPLIKPDCDNIAKIVLDSLNGIAFEDDKQVTVLHVEKVYSETPCVKVALQEKNEGGLL